MLMSVDTESKEKSQYCFARLVCHELARAVTINIKQEMQGNFESVSTS